MDKISGKSVKAGKNNKEVNKEKSGSKKSAREQLPGFAGNLYQSKWLMWYLLKGLSSKYEFELGTEVEDAGKYDDIVFKYKKIVDGNERDHFIIMQSKHKANTDKKITYQDVLTDGNVDLGLVKYFNSFVESKNAKMFKNGEIEHAIIYTNARFDMDGKIQEKDQNWKELKNLGNITEEMKLEQDDTLSAFKIKGGKFYQFKIDLVLPVLKSLVLEYEYYKIARKLIECLKDQNKYLSLDDKILKRYNHILLTEVIDKKSKMFQNNFIKESCDDVEINSGRKKLRRALDKVLNDEGLKIEDIAEKKFEWRRAFEKIEQTTQIWPTDIDDTDLKEFLKRSIFATEQPDDTKLGKIILVELRKQTNNPIFDEELIHGYFAIEIHNWMKGGNFSNKSENISKSAFISFKEAEEFFKHTVAKFNKILLKGQTPDYDCHIQEYKISFVDLEFDSAIQNFLNSNQRILSIISKHIMISSIKLKKNIESEEFIYIKLSLSNKVLLNAAVQTFESESTDRLLVIEWDCDETILYEWSDKINDIIYALQSHNQKKLIIISNRFDILEKYFQDDFFVDTEYIERQDNANTLENIEKDLHDLLLNTMVKFQGKDAKLKDFIITDNLKKAVDGDILQKILKRENVNIGKQTERLKAEVQRCYVNRTFIRKVENDKNVYLISEINEGELILSLEYQNFKIIEKYEFLTQNTIDTIKREVDENKSKDVYLLKKGSNELVLCKKPKHFFEESDFRNAIKCEHNKSEINLVSSVAGTGKSTFFTKLSQKMKNENPELWVVKIDLIVVSSKLREIQNSNSVDIQWKTVVDFLHHGAKNQSELEKTIFEHRLQCKNVVLLLDGFDEVCPSYKSIVLKIIQVLEEKAAIKTTWISTRPYDSILKDMKKTFAKFHVKYYNFEPLTEDIQIEYLKIFWQMSIEVDEEFFKVYPSTMLIGVNFKDTFIEFQNTNISEISIEQQQKLLEMLDLFKLYDKFVKFKCEIHCKDKTSLNLDTEAGKNMLSESYKSCLKKSKILALDSLLNENELKILLTEIELKELKEYKDEIEEKGDAFGIANQIVDGKPQFIHRTFAEYFVAMFFIENLKRNDKKSQKIAEYFLKNMINDENSVICDFIDSKLNDEPNFIEYYDKYGNVVMKMEREKLYFVLERKWQNIGEIFIKNGIDMNYDRKRKTILYPASQLERSKDKIPILSLIFEKMNYEKNALKSELLKTHGFDTPFFSAARYGSFENIKIIFEICKKMGILDDILFEKYTLYGNIIHIAINCNNDCFTSVMNLLKSEPSKLKALLIEMDSALGYTPIHVAVKTGEQNKFEALWNLCEELNISSDSVIFNETEFDENIIHIAADSDCNDDYFMYLMNLLKCKPDKFRSLLIKKNICSCTPFDEAVKKGQRKKFETMLKLCGELLISTDSILFNETKDGVNIIHLAVDSDCNDDFFIYLMNLLNSEPDKLKALVIKKDKNGHTPFDEAVKKGQRKKFENMFKLCGELLISTDSILFNETKDDVNIIHQAADSDCNDDFFIYLINLLKIDPNKLKTLLTKMNSYGITPFDIAVRKGQQNKFEIMLNLCGELDISTDCILFNETKDGENIIHLAADSDCNDDFFIYLINILKIEPKKLKTLLTKMNSYGCTPFYEAVKKGQQKKFETMLKLCGELLISTDSILLNATKDGVNIIHLAANSDCNDDFFIYLINLLKSEPNKLKTLLTKMNSYGITPFDVAARKGQRNKFEIMLNLCGELDIPTDCILFKKTKDGVNIIHIAANSDCNDRCFIYLVNLLKSEPDKLKALLTSKHRGGHTPFDEAVKNSQEYKFETMLNLCEELDISIDNILFNETEDGVNIIHLAASSFDDCFIYLMNLLKSEPDILKALLTKQDRGGRTPYDIAKGSKTKLKILNDILDELDNVS